MWLKEKIQDGIDYNIRCKKTMSYSTYKASVDTALRVLIPLTKAVKSGLKGAANV